MTLTLPIVSVPESLDWTLLKDKYVFNTRYYDPLCMHAAVESSKKKWLYLNHLTSNQEGKDTSFPLSFKVEGNNVPLFSWLEVK